MNRYLKALSLFTSGTANMAGAQLLGLLLLLPTGVTVGLCRIAVASRSIRRSTQTT